MGKIYCVMGKSSSGKDSIYSRIMQQGNPALLRIVPYTTRPRREGETDGREYVFTDETHVQQLESAGKVIELRAYHTVYGIWKYFTVDDGRIDLVGAQLSVYCDTGRVSENTKILWKLTGSADLYRSGGWRAAASAIARERQQKTPQYEEMCRRFLADAADFSEERLTEAGITRRFINKDMEGTIREITEYIRRDMSGMEKQDKRISIWR